VTVRTTTADKEEPLVLGKLLKQGDVVKVGAKSRVSFLLHNGSILVGKPGQELQLGSKIEAGKPQLQKVARNLVKTFQAASADAPMMKHVGGLRAGNSNIALVPRQTRVRHDRAILFQWLPRVHSQKYKVIIMGADGYYLEKMITNQSFWKLTAGPLKSDRVYFWEVHDGSQPNSMIALGSGEFTTASESSIAALIDLKKDLAQTYPDTDPAKDTTPLFLLYQLYRTHGFSYDALNVVLSLLEKNPGHEQLTEMKIELMKKMNLREKDLDELAQIKKIDKDTD